MAASVASRELFTDAVRAVLHSWPVLQIAVENGFGGAFGPQKADWMVDVVQQYFHDNGNLYSESVSMVTYAVNLTWGVFQKAGYAALHCRVSFNQVSNVTKTLLIKLHSQSIHVYF
uniref:Pre-rRNA-processing protein TSR2 homolog n=1 Tax=Oryzias sinensis TaxID=183150 RepID=A0A8C7WQE9_9TELE